MAKILKSIPIKRQFMNQHVVVQLGYVLVFNTAIATLLTLLWPQSIFWHVLLVSQCIGLTIFFSFYIFSHFMELKGWIIGIPLSIGAISGVLLGVLAIFLLHNKQVSEISNFIKVQYDILLVNLFIAFFFGIIIIYFFISRERHYQATHALKESQIKNLDHKKHIAETQLQLLQAQIEPHFLFNSLSNVISLIEHDPNRAKLMLESLTHYLRSSLSRSHNKDGTLRDELDLIENYLKILQIRMGERLQYKINVEAQLLDYPFPIMLLQPLVENAIKHGLEPLSEGGLVVIEAKANDKLLRINVIDNGAGLKNDNLKGFGLMNVRQRLQSLFGNAGQLTLANKPPQGTLVSIEMPYE